MATDFPKHRAALAWAVSQIGQMEEPLGSNKGGFVQFCQAHTWLDGTGWPWCAAFAITAIEEGGGDEYPDRTAGAWDLLARAQKRGWSLGVGAKSVTPGDLVVFNIGSGHVGVVESVTPAAVTSIDGNSGDRVARCVRSLSTVRGFVHWPEDLPAHAPSKPPITTIIRSVSGTRKLAVAGVTIPLPARKDKIT